jgi:hypothetical protein
MAQLRSAELFGDRLTYLRNHHYFVINRVHPDESERLCKRIYEKLLPDKNDAGVRCRQVLVARSESEIKPTELSILRYAKICILFSDTRKSQCIDVFRLFKDIVSGYVLGYNVKDLLSTFKAITCCAIYPAYCAFDQSPEMSWDNCNFIYKAKHQAHLYARDRMILKNIGQDHTPPEHCEFFQNLNQGILKVALQRFLSELAIIFKARDYSLQPTNYRKFAFNDWRRKVGKFFNRWAVHPFDKQPTILPKEYHHFWIYGPANTLKTTFIIKVLLANIPPECIFRPNITSGIKFMMDGYSTALHKAVVIDEAPNLRLWNTSYLKDFLGMEEIVINGKGKPGYRSRVQCPVFFMQNHDEMSDLYKNPLELEGEFPGFSSRILFVQAESNEDISKTIHDHRKRRENERKAIIRERFPSFVETEGESINLHLNFF